MQDSLTTLCFDVKINAALLHRLFNEASDGVFSSLPPLQIDYGTIALSKVAPITMHITGKEIQWTAPIRLSFEGRSFASFVRVEASIRCSFCSSITFENHWQINPKTTLVHYEWIDRPDLRISGLKFSISKWIDKQITKKKTAIEKQIDRSILRAWEAMAFAKKIETFFRKEHTIDIGIPLHVRLLPKKISIAPFENELGYIRSAIHTEGTINLHSSCLSMPRDEPLPSPTFDKQTQTKSYALVHTQLSYEALEGLLQKKLYGMSILLSPLKKHIKIKSLRLRRNKNLLQIIAQCCGTFNGQITFDGKTQYSEHKNELAFHIEKLHLTNKVGLGEFFLNLFAKKIKKKLNAQLRFPLKQLKNEASEKLQNIAIAPHSQAMLYIDDIRLEHFRQKESGLEAVVHLTGRGEVNIE